MTVYIVQKRVQYEGAELVAVYQDEDKAIDEQKRLGTREDNDWIYHTVTSMEVQ